MREVRLPELTRGRPGADRVALLSIWFRGHNNPRYAELLPRLARLDACLLRLPENRIARGIGFRAFTWTKPALLRAALSPAARRYEHLLALDFEQLGVWRNACVMDADDPFFTPREVSLLNRAAVRAYVVTAESAARRYESLGVAKPWVVIPQGVNLRAATPELRQAAAAAKRPGEVVLGWMAAHLLTAGDRGAENPLYNVDHLLDLWDEVHARVPAARLWLVGEPSERLRARLAGRDDVVLHGRLPRERALAVASTFDLAPYARTADQGIRAAKVSELLGLGVPIVSYDYEVTANVREAGAGVLVRDARAFADVTARLLASPEERAPYAAAAARTAPALDWDVLAERFEREVLNTYLPPTAARPGRGRARA
ncbi:MAG TPA: glycosyltransferase [Gaiellaceae bacterium]